MFASVFPIAPPSTGQLACFALLGAALLVVLAVRNRTKRRNTLTWLYDNRLMVRYTLRNFFEVIDHDQDGVISFDDIADTLEAKKINKYSLQVLEELQTEIPTVGHLVTSRTFVSGNSGTGAVCTTDEQYGIGPEDINLVNSRLVAALRKLGRKPLSATVQEVPPPAK